MRATPQCLRRNGNLITRTRLIFQMKSMTKSPSDQILVATKRAIPACLTFMLISIGLSYPVYADDFSVSGWPWKISVFLAFMCCLGNLIIYFIYRGTNALYAYGMILLMGMFPIYYFFGIFGYFYFFIFAPVTAYLRWPGLFGGILLTIYWAAITYRNITNTIRITSFVEHAFEERGDHINYEIQEATRAFERHYKEENPFPKFFMSIVYGIAPFYLILNRILSSNFGAVGVLLFVAILGMPVSLWLIGALLRCYLVMVALPLRIEKERRKRVIAVG